MDNIPDLVLVKIAEYLPPEDIVRLSLTCRRFRHILPHFLRFRGEDFEIHGPHWGHFTPEPYFDGPVLQATVKSLKASVYWTDQGWGNRKGKVLLKLMRPLAGSKESKEIAGNDMFGVAEHQWKTATCLLTDDPVVQLARAGDYYRFIRNAGGGGGHTLRVRNFSVLLELNSKQN